MNRFSSGQIYAELKVRCITSPRILDGLYVIDKNNRKVACYATPFGEEAYWFFQTPSQPISANEINRTKDLDVGILFHHSTLEHGLSDKAKALDDAL